MTSAPLRGCPMCGTPVADVKLGLRDYRWLADALPGKVAPTDLDFVLERRGRFLVLEFKPAGASLPLGQRLTLKQLVRAGMDVWVVWGEDLDFIQVGAVDKRGDVPFVADMTVNRLKRYVADWFKEVSDE